MNPRIGRSLNRLGITLKKNAPEITTVLSAIGVIGTGVLSARAAYKSTKAINEHREVMEQLRANKENFDDNKEYNKEVAVVYKNTAIEMLKVYWPAAVCSGLTIAGIFTTNAVHRKRYFTMAGMYASVSAAYKEYRKRVSEKYGEETERELYYNVKREELVTVETDKKGNEKTKVDIVMSPNVVDNSDYSLFLLKPGDKVWYYNRPDLTYYKLKGYEAVLTQMLRSRGYLFLNEVLRTLELPEIPEGQVIGWVYDEDKSDTDNCVDFGLKDGTENFEFFMNGKNEFLYITMNHDGTIYDKFPSFDRFWKRNSSGRV